MDSRDKMKYYVYVTNASNHNSLHKFNSLHEADELCKDASYHNSCYIFKGEDMKFYKRKEKTKPIEIDNEPFWHE